MSQATESKGETMFDVRVTGAYLSEDMGDEITAYADDEGAVSVGFPWDRDYPDDWQARARYYAKTGREMDD